MFLLRDLDANSYLVVAALKPIAEAADNPPPPPVPTGAASNYTINFTCSGVVVGDSCGESPTISIPLNLTSSNPATPECRPGPTAPRARWRG